MKTVKEYIEKNWYKTIRMNKEDNDKLLGLPFPYSVPCIDGMFQEMYYWDTYFTNVGLIHSGLIQQAENNINNMCYLINKYGFMPNGNTFGYLSRSQPPFLSLMVKEVYLVNGDKEWLKECYKSLEKEYSFWQTERITSSGLNRYFGKLSNEERIRYAKYMCVERFSIPIPQDEETLEQYGENIISLCESGWDCNSRFGKRAHEGNWLDLNALLYGFEKNMEYFSSELNNGKTSVWVERAQKRKALMIKLMWDENSGAFYDYDFVNGKRLELLTTATFYPMFCNMCNDYQAECIVKNLQKLELQYGISSSENKQDLLFLQWDYPSGWPCQQYIVIHALLNYGYKDDALRIAGKYVDLVDRVFAKTGKLWEKYNVFSGDVSVTREYETPEMLGWTAGVYLDCINLIKTVK